MLKFILGEKKEQSQQFTEKGKRIPVTYIKTTPCMLIDIQMPSKQGYCAVKLGFGNTKKIVKSQLGETKKAGIKTPLRFFKEFRLPKDIEKEIIEENGKRGIVFGETKVFIGDAINPTVIFKNGDLVKISGISKGKGFQGVVKRHHFAGGPKTHGQSDRQRGPGAIGSTTTPGRVYKGKRMAGRMGGERISVKNLEIIEINNEGIKVKGLVPGTKGGLLEVVSSI